METIADINTDIIKEFRENQGRLGGQFAGGDFLILHTRGARTGRERLSPMAYLPGDGRYYVFAVGLGEVGAARHPAWYHNLVANPDVTIEVGSQVIPATAMVLQGAERQRIWEAMIAHNAHFATYRGNRDREIPAIALTPKAEGSEDQRTL
jgi:deazaflavin-dependent oxidoreductase (nitroreductase family)